MEDLPVGVEALRRQAFDLSQLTNRVGAVENAIRGRLIPPRGVQGNIVGFDSGGLPALVDASTVTPVPWTTFPYGAGVSDFGAGFGPPKYMKDVIGTVFSRGLVQCSVTSAGTGIIGTMPAGCRPGVAFRFPIQVNGVTKDANITTAGVITVAHASTDWVSVTFSYKAEA